MGNKTYETISVARWATCVTLLCAMAWSVPDARGEWRVSPELGLGLEHDDNVRLAGSGGLTSSDSAVSAEALADFRYRSQITEFTMTPRFRTTRYQDDRDLDTDDYFLRMKFDHEGRKSSFAFRGDFSSESVRTAERSGVDFDIEDPEDIPTDDTGDTSDTGNRDRFSLSPEFIYNFTERASLRIDGDYLDTNYDDDVSAQLSDFSEYRIGAALGYRFSERDTISLYTQAGEFEVDSTNFTSSSTAVVVGYNRRISERTQFRALFGTESAEDESGADQRNSIGEISVIHRYALSRVIASYQRTVDGSGSGRLSVRDAFSLLLTRPVSPKLTLSGGIRAYSTDALDSADVTFPSRDYLQVRGLARWNATRKVSVDFEYVYTDIERDTPAAGSSDGDSNMVGIWLRWHPSPLPD